MDKKIAVVLLNLGGPLKEADIRPFLFNFFMDKNIITAPRPIRNFIAKYISWKRGKGPALKAYRQLGGKSPLLENTEAQGRALERKLLERGAKARVFVVMRYWHPFAHETARDVLEYAPDEIVLLPLYPQFSTTTTFSSFENWDQAAQKAGMKIPTRKICCYPEDAGFISASADLIQTAFKAAPSKTRLLFSAHGLPEKIIQGGDPYQYQCEKAAEKIAKVAGVSDWQICYQSRVGPLKWIGPSTEEALAQAAKDGVGVLVYPHAFVSEHVETLVEIEQEYRQKAKELGIPFFGRVPTVSTHPLFIEGLAELVLNKNENQRHCSATYKRCYCGGKTT